ncbi:Bcr/CflA family drug resistance efflux transporter [Falsiroseomonas bella]|uniref:Bcr/CflA family efflux transporter n=1 Tax=Falsiroseomonas bella TaxID=2184016 RepID=A0A317F603_9PROT|nr:multidrug effflux MFS transporter [Falsiroseomonas bella]PWS34610.1 Bcr/CflA family drug resistance efflux transporter [Falsiroseomonas bella]
MAHASRRLAALLASLTALGPLGVDMYLPAFPAMALDLSADPSAVQRTLAAFLFGMAAGQLVVGPLSDRFGRRSPLLAGLALFALASAGCALAASAEALAWLRLAQALGGCAGMVVARAVVRDVADEREAVRMMATLMLVMGAAPILAPMAGGLLLAAFGWRSIFWALAAYALAAIVLIAVALPESLPPERRRRQGPGAIVIVYGQILRDRRFLAHALAGAFPMLGLFAYLTASPQVLMGLHGLSPGEYAVAFGSNAFGLILASQIIARLVRRVPPPRLIVAALTACAVAGVSVPLAVASGGLWPLLLALFVFLSVMGAVLPLASALAMAPLGHVAGSASALIGTLQFGGGAAVGLLIGAVGAGSAWPMALLLACAGMGGLGLHLALRR